MSVTHFRDLQVWQSGMALAERVYRVSQNWPKSETFGLTGQIRRAAISVPSNLAEGHARDSTKDFLRFVSIAFGSIAEIETQAILAGKLGYLGDPELKDLLSHSGETGRMLRGLQQKLKTIANTSP